MFNAHKILQTCHRAVDEQTFLDLNINTKEANYHRSVRLAALLHDLGTFPFSHTTEQAYIKFDSSRNNNKKSGTKKDVKDDHEHLGSYIIKNTDFPGGITAVLKKYNIDPQEISDLVKGVAPSIMANQILHSEIDCDRMDYLLRDAHYTGIKYGSYDRDYLLNQFKSARIGDHDILTIRQNGLHCVADFLAARFAWYSQVIRSPRGARNDAMAAELCAHLLEKKKIYRYEDLLDIVTSSPLRFFEFHDAHFLKIVHTLYLDDFFAKNRKLNDIARTILLKEPVYNLNCKEFQHQLLDLNDEKQIQKVIKKAQDKAEEITEFLKKKGSKEHWIVKDFPHKNIIFVKSRERLIKEGAKKNVLLTRDPVKIHFENGDIRLLADVETSIISRLQNVVHYTPNVFCNQETYEFLNENFFK